MLDADEHRLLVWRDHHASELALFGTDQEPADLSARWIGAEHLVVAEAGVIAGLSEDVDTSIWIQSRPLGATKIPSGTNLSPTIVEPWAGTAGSPERAKTSQVKVGLGEVMVVAPRDDVAEDVGRARVDGVDGGRAEPATVLPSGLLLDAGFVPRRLLL